MISIPMIGAIASNRIASSSLYDQYISDSPRVYWRLNESSGSALSDSSLNSITGTLYNTYSLSQPSLAPNDIGSSILFNGGYAKASNNFIPESSNASFTIAFLIKHTKTGVCNFLQSTVSSSVNRIFIQLNRNASATLTNGSFRISGSTATESFSFSPTNNPNINDGNIHLVHIVKDGLTPYIYIDGVSVSVSTGYISTFPSGSISSSSERYVIGSDSLLSAPCTAYIDEFATFYSALSAARISSHASAAGF